MPFDPDKYLAEKSGANSAGGFDPERYLSEKSAVHPETATPPPSDAGPRPGLLREGRVWDAIKQELLHGHAPNAIEPSVGKNLAYPGGVLSTAAIQGAKELMGSGGSADDMKAALAGDAKGAPQQLKEAGLPTAAAYGMGIPLQVLTDPMAEFGSAPMRAAANPVASYIGNRLKSGAESFATSPVFEKVSDATNVVGAGKTILEKITDKLQGTIPEALQPAADAAGGIAGRVATYKSPLAPVQAVSDAAKGVSFMQTGVAKALDHGSRAVQALKSSKLFTDPQLQRLASTPFFQALERAGEAGGSDGVATTHYVLQQTDPEYQRILKEQQ